MNEYEMEMDSLTLIPGSGGAFEVVVDGKTVFSKKQSGRFPEPGEVEKAISR